LKKVAAVIGEKAAEAVAGAVGAKAGEKIAEKIFKEAEERQYLQKLKELTQSLKNRFFGKRKLLIVGGGEIATEIAIAALETKKWIVRSIVGQDPSQKNSFSVEKTKVPIANLLNYIGKSPKTSKCYTTIEEADPSVRFQYAVVENLHNLDYLARYIVNEKPDVVLLEDMFLTAEDWTSLSLVVSKKLGASKSVHFVPSPDEECTSGSIQSDAFLSKIKMKEFLIQIGYSENLLDTAAHGKIDIVNTESLAKELGRIGKKRTILTSPEYARIKNAVKKHKKIILKPESTTSGHGQFIISDSSQLEVRRFCKRLLESMNFVQTYRVKNEKYVIEKYLENKMETCGIIGRLPGRKRALLDRVYYSKYDMERVNYGRFYGLTRLVSSETRKDDNQLWTKLNEIARHIADQLNAPFLYVEFLLDSSQKDDYGIPKIYINEISYRPDDAGFVTLISHKRSQFSIFVESLNALLSQEHKSESKREIYQKAIDTYVCKTINPSQQIQFYKEGLSIDYPARAHPRNRVMLRLYEKYLAESEGTIDYGRLIGYVWHHSSEDDSKTWKYIESMRLALGEEGLNLLKKSVEETASAISSTAKIHSISTHEKTIVLSDWEGPWVTADYAYDIMKAVVPNGDRLFSAISEYDDYLAYVKKKKGYEPGDTLALIAPFLIAYDIEEKTLNSIARKSAKFIRGSTEAIEVLRQLGYPLRVVSTSYCQYVWYTTSLVGIPQENTKCTIFPIADFKLNVKDGDKRLVKEMIPRILNLGKLGINASSTEKDLPAEARETINTMDEFFWEVLPQTSFESVLENIKPLGGKRKLEALQEFLKEENRSPKEAVVIGDSITDWVMLKKASRMGSLAISFNGNAYAVKNAKVAVASVDCMITPVLVQIYGRSGIKEIEHITKNWNPATLREEVTKGYLDQALFDHLLKLNSRNELPMAYWITKKDIDTVIEKSSTIRKSVRGYAVGSLG